MALSTSLRRGRVTVASWKFLVEDDAQDGGESSGRLEAGYWYSLGLANVLRVTWRFVRWWEYRTKEEVSTEVRRKGETGCV